VRIAGNLPPVSARIGRMWTRGTAHLRYLLGVGNSREDVTAFLSQMPDEEFAMSARSMGLTDEQIEDAAWGVATGESPWPGGRPLTEPQAALVQRREQLKRELQAIEKSLNEEENDE
jgi:hypothetical protein